MARNPRRVDPAQINGAMAPLAIYMAQISEFELLTAQREIELFGQIDDSVQRCRQTMNEFPGMLMYTVGAYERIKAGASKLSKTLSVKVAAAPAKRPEAKKAKRSSALPPAQSEQSKSQRSAQKRKVAAQLALAAIRDQLAHLREGAAALNADLDRLVEQTRQQNPANPVGPLLLDAIADRCTAISRIVQPYPLQPDLQTSLFAAACLEHAAAVRSGDPVSEAALRSIRWFGCSVDAIPNRISAVRGIWTSIEQLQNRVWESNLRLVVNIAKSYVRPGFTLGDLISMGNLGLREAVIKFDGRYATKFSTYASYWIKQGIKRGMIDEGRTIRVPVWAVELLSQLRAVVNESLEAGLGVPTLKELASRLKMRVSSLKPVWDFFNREVISTSLDPVSPVAAIPVWVEPGRIADETRLPEVHETIWRVVGKLDEVERTIIIRRLGLDGEEPSTLKEVGESLGYTKERIRQLQNEISARLSEDPEMRLLWDLISA